jgi:hypothetical protein
MRAADRRLAALTLAARAAGLGAPVFALGVLAVAAAPILLALRWLGPPLAAGLTFGVMRAVRGWHRRPEPEAPPGMHAPVSLAELVATEARAIGLPVPAVRITSDRSVRWRAGSLDVGLFALGECSPERLRVRVASALLAGADRSARRLRRRREFTLAIMLAESRAHPRRSLPWAWAARAASGLADRALDEHRRQIELRVEARYGVTAARALREPDDHAVAFASYWSDWVTPALEAGFRPALLDGWLGVLGEPDDGDERVVVAPELELALLEAIDPQRAVRLVPLEWEQYGTAVVLPQARACLPDDLDGAVAADLPLLVTTAREPGRLDELANAALVALADADWDISARAGRGVRAVAGELAVDPYVLILMLAADPEEGDRWTSYARDAGIAELPLARRTAPAAMDAMLDVLPDERVELVLRTRPDRRWTTLLILAGAIVVALPVTVMVGVAVGGWARSRLRTVQARGRLIIDRHGVRVEHPRLLRAPFAVPRECVRAVVLDDRPGRTDVSIPVAVSPWAADRRWLWIAGESIAPVLAADRERPNLALVLTGPQAGPAVRRETRHGPQRGEAIGGLLLSVEPVPGVAGRLARLGFAPELTADDARVLYEACHGPS